MNANIDTGTLRKYVTDIHELILRKNLDWMSIISGREGQGGKSTLGIWRALVVNPDFDPENQVIYNLESFLTYLDTHADKPGRVGFFDEAVLLFLGSEANTWEARRFQKLFVTHRDLCQEFYLCAPSPWRLLPYLREDRVNDFLLGYMDPQTEDFDRHVAYYNREDYVRFITNRQAKKDILVPSRFVGIHKPTHLEPFILPKSSRIESVYNKIFKLKKEAQRDLREDTKLGIEERREDEAEAVKRNPVKDVAYPIATRLVYEEHYTIKRACELCNMSADMYYAIRRGAR